MSNCCEHAECVVRTERTICPSSGTKGTPVDIQTVKALLTTAALQRLQPGAHFFCSKSTCDVVYFGERGLTFSTEDVRVGVWQKQFEGDRVICYCFGENEANIRAEIAEAGHSSAVERVRAHIQAGRCACEVRNPRGRCCLGDLSVTVKRMVATVAASATETVS